MTNSEEGNWTHAVEVSAAVCVAAFAATRVATSDATVQAHEVALSVAGFPATYVAMSGAQSLASEAAPVLANDIITAVASGAVLDEAAIPAALTAIAPATRETVVGAGMQTGPFSTKYHIYE